MEAARVSRDEMSAATKELEKKFKALEADNLRQQQELAASERARKDLQAEKDELSDEIANKLRYCFVASHSHIYFGNLH